MFLYTKWLAAITAMLLLPTAIAFGAVQLKFNMDDVEGDTSYFPGTNPTNYNTINWDIDLEDNGVELGLDPNTLAGVNGQNVADAIDFVTGSTTGISLTISSTNGWNELGPNRDGTLSPGAPASTHFNFEATDSSLFGHSSNFNIGEPRDFVEYTIAGLSPSALYDFTFFAARFGAAENRETQYDVIGLNNGVGFLDVKDNNNNIAQVLQIQPDGSGEMKLTIQAGPNNQNSNLFFYLGAFEILENGAVAGVAGDFDGDLDVDGQDFLNWQRGESPNNGNAADLTAWKSGYGTPANLAAVGSVPEPTSAVLLLLGSLGLTQLGCVRRR